MARLSGVTWRLVSASLLLPQQALQATQQSLIGLYDGNPKRKTSRPSAEQILKAFCHLTLYFLPDCTLFITPLNALQQQLLSLMRMPESLYQLDSKLCKT